MKAIGVVPKKEKLAVLIFGILSLIITVVTFRAGNVLGGGEVGAAFYDPQRIFEMIKYAWSNVHLGITSGLMPASTPFFGLLGWFQKIGVAPVLIQALYFLFLFFLTQTSMFYLSKNIFPNIGVRGWFLAAAFYQFNPYSILNVWNRFLPNTMLFYAALPLCLLFFINSVRKKNYAYVVVMALVTAAFSYAFSAPAQTLLFWGFISITAFYFFIHGANKVYILKVFFLSFVLWFLTNFWWISQQFSYSRSSTYTTSTQQFFTDAGNISTFLSLSKSLGQFQDLLVFSHGRISHEALDYPYQWPRLYSNSFYTVFAWLSLVVTLYFAIKNIKKAYVPYLLGLFTIGIFMSKGNLPPFGILFYKAFEKVFLFQFFRNPFEKIGYLTVFAFSLLFSFAIVKFESKLGVFMRNAVYLSALMFVFLFNGFPFFTGLVFTSDLYPSNNVKNGIQVEIPDNYKTLNNAMQDLCEDCRYVAMPLGLGEGIYYNWPKGYVGLEQSGFLFVNPGISHNTTFPYYGIVSAQLEKLFLRQDEFDKVARILNSPFVVVRGDIDYKRSRMRDPQKIEQRTLQLQEKGKLNKINSDGELSLYTFDSIDPSKIYAANALTLTGDAGNLSQIFFTDFGDKEILMPYQNAERLEPVWSNPSTIYVNEAYFESFNDQYKKLSEEPYIFPFVQTLPTSPKYNMILLKESLEGVFKFDIKDRTYWELLLLGKRLKEVQLASEKNDLTAAKKSLKIYEKNLPGVFDKLKVLNLNFRRSGERIWNEQEMLKLFGSHLYLFIKLESTKINSEGDVGRVKNKLMTMATQNNIVPMWEPAAEGEKRSIYKITVARDGEYEILLPSSDFFPNAFINSSEMSIQVDGDIVHVPVVQKDGKVSLGKRFFNSGTHEISLNNSSNDNLVNYSEEIVLEAIEKDEKLEIPFIRYSPFSDYTISFDYKIEYGAALSFSVKNDNDYIENNSGYYFRKTFNPDNYYFGINHFEVDFQSYPLADAATLIFEIRPWNNCLSVYFNNPTKCKNESTYKIYNKPTKVVIKNIKVQPKLPKSIFLVQENEDRLVNVPNISYTKINPTKYDVKITNATSPFVVVFSEAFDSRWMLLDKGTGEKLTDENHFLVNGYANSWLVNKTGDYELSIYYEPQTLLEIGYKISIFTVFLLVVYLFMVRFITIKKNE